MTESTQQSTLSSTYWELHRNTLLFSSLLLIICIPGAKPATAQSFLWLSFSDVAFNSLRFIVACAATYAFSTYLLEWWNEGYTLLRRENALAVSSRERLDHLVTQSTRAIQPLGEKFHFILDGVQARLQPNHNVGVVYTDEQIEEIIEDSYRTIENLRPTYSQLPYLGFQKGLYQLQARHQPFNQETIGALALEAIRAMSFQVARESTKRVNSNNTQVLEGFLSDATEACKALQDSLDRISDRREGLWQLARRTNCAIFMFRSRSYARIILTGLAIPLIVYTTALAHLGGQIGIAHLPSLFTLIQGAPSKEKQAGGTKVKGLLAPASTKA